MQVEELIVSDRYDSVRAYQEMTPAERAKYDVLVAQLDQMLCERKSKERRQQVMCISFPDRREGDRRRG
jgi:predicted nuclease of restriction endonuclease-like (RecB) superfamily